VFQPSSDLDFASVLREGDHDIWPKGTGEPCDISSTLIAAAPRLSGWNHQRDGKSQATQAQVYRIFSVAFSPFCNGLANASLHRLGEGPTRKIPKTEEVINVGKYTTI